MSKNYNEQDVLNALADIEKNNTQVRKAAFKNNIPKSTLIDRIKNQNTGFHGKGTTTALSKETEQLLVHMLKCFGDWGYGLTFKNVQSIVEDYLNLTNQTAIFKKNDFSNQLVFQFNGVSPSL